MKITPDKIQKAIRDAKSYESKLRYHADRKDDYEKIRNIRECLEGLSK